MMTFKKIILHPAAFVLALIPIINLIYFVLFFAFASAKKLIGFLFGAIACSMIFFWISHRFLPDRYEFLAFYIITVLLSATAYYLLRAVLKGQNGLPKAFKMRLIIGAGIVLFIGVVGVVMTNVVDLQPQTETLLQAIIDNDEEAFQTVSYKDELTLSAVRRALDEQGITLHGSLQWLSTGELTVSGRNGETLQTAEYTFQIGNEKYIVQVTYRISDSCEGISEIVIRKG